MIRTLVSFAADAIEALAIGLFCAAVVVLSAAI